MNPEYQRGFHDALTQAADEQERLAYGPRALGNRAVAFKRLIFATWLRERAESVKPLGLPCRFCRQHHDVAKACLETTGPQV